MALYKRTNGVFYIDLVVGRQRIRKSTGTQDERKAKELHDKIAHERWQTEKLGNKPRKTWKEAVTRYLKESRKKTITDDIYHLRFVDEYFKNLFLDEINKDLLNKVIEERFKTKVSIAT